MDSKPKRTAITMLVAAALAMPAAAVQAQQTQQQQRSQQQQTQQQAQQTQQQARDLPSWDVAVLYADALSAEEMIDADVRGPNGEEIGEVKEILVGGDGRISRVVVEVGGFLEIADQHIGVPWKDVIVGPNMEWVGVPLKEVEDGTYALHGRVPQGEKVPVKAGEWRVSELIGDFASLEDVPRYGEVTDVIFNRQGEAQGVIVDRAAGAWGAAGWYGYPWHGRYSAARGYALPYRGAEVGDYGRFDYMAFAEASDYAGNASARRTQPGGAAGPTGPEGMQPGK